MISVALFVAMAYAAIALLDTSWHFLWTLAYVCRKAYKQGLILNQTNWWQ